jgi:arabinan endo-1,5-alpha-L-arabinosidase
MLHSIHNLRIRDPFIVPVEVEKRYYLFATNGSSTQLGSPRGFDAYTSSDLELWEGPMPAFRPPSNFWADQDFWAPEVHFYHGRWFMFASFKAEGVCRATQILVSNRIEGPYLPHGDSPVTPREWECLDGTLFVDEQHQPWMIFCHEWLQVHDGEMCAIALSSDLSQALGEPLLLFRASEATWSKPFGPENNNRVTDGPFLHRTASGALLMLWSTGGFEGYTIGCARSKSGAIQGPWIQDAQPLYGKDGGHGMLFRTFAGRLMLSIHQPNESPHERSRFLPVHEESDRLVFS